jgi:hypothetical protein
MCGVFGTGVMAMGRTIGRLGAIIGLGFWLAACSGSSKTSDKPAVDRVCEPGTKSCDGQNVKVCSDDGSERTIEQTCSPSQTCADGACAETNCVPNTKFCQGNEVWKCDSTGSGSSLSQSCAKSQFCREADDSATCSDQACTGGQAMCDGDIATTCEADGSGPKAGGADCAANKQACFEGKCQDTACLAGAKLCMNEDVYLCAKNGTDTSLLADCQMGTVCDGDKLACVAKVCEIGAAGCDGTRAVNCNAFGSGWDPAGTDCATDNRVCVAGECKKQTCTPSATFCQGGNVYQCDQSGVSSALYQTCTPNYYHCTPYPSANYAVCDYNQCQPNQLLCDNNIARTCNPDGSWPTAGTDCGSDKYCDTGACKTRVCDAGTIFCKDGDVYGCDWLGSSASLYQDCPTDTTCNVTNGNYSCIPLPCSPGDTVCLGNKIGTCAADGQSLGTVTTDCTTAGSICGTDNKCAKSVVDILGVDEPQGDISEPSTYFVGDVIQVTSARKLTEMQFKFLLPPTRSVRWVVFQETSDSNFTAKQDWVVADQSGSGFFSSGAISYALQAGKTYLLGAVVTGGNQFTAYLDTGPFAINASFGTVLGRVESGYSSTMGAYIDSGYLYQMKLTTTP